MYKLMQYICKYVYIYIYNFLQERGEHQDKQPCLLAIHCDCTFLLNELVEAGLELHETCNYHL